MAAESVGQIGLDLVVNKNDFAKQMNGIEKMAKRAGAALAGAFAVKKIFEFGKACLELGSDLSEVQNVVDVTFPSMSVQIDEFAKNAITSFGLSETMAKKFTGTFGAMAESFGFSEKAAYEMSTTLTGLAGDIASFYNISQDEAYTKLKSVFTGETESLKELGVVMTQSALDAYAMANGFGKTTQAMSEAEKVALRYQFVQSKLSAAQGDFARTSDSWANQMRVLNLQMQSIMATIGQGLINLFTPIVKVINIVLGKIATLANAFKAFTELITGKKSSGTSGTGLKDLGASAEAAGIGMENASGAADNMTSSANKAGNAAKKAAKEMRALMGFDQINKLTDQSDTDVGTDAGSTGGSTGSALGSSVDFGSLAKGETVVDEVDGKFSSLLKKAKDLSRLFQKGFQIGFGDSEKKILSLKNHLSGISDSLFKIFTDTEVARSAEYLLDSIAMSFGKLVGSTASIGLTIADNFVGGIDGYLGRSGEYISERIASIFDVSSEITNIFGNNWTAFANTFSVFRGKNGKRITASIIGIFSDGFLGAVDLAGRFGRDIINTISAPFVENQELIKEAVDKTLEPIASALETVWTGCKETAEKALRVYDTYVAPLFESLRNGFTEIAANILEWYLIHIAPVLDSLSEKFDVVWSEHIQPFLDSFLQLFGNVAEMLKALWEEILQPLLQWMIDNILPVLGPILSDLGTAILTLLRVAADVCKGIIDSMSGLAQFFTGVFSGDWNKGMDGLEIATKGLQDALEAIFRFVKEEIFQRFDDYLQNIFEKDWTESFGEFGNVLNGFFDTVEKVWEEIKGIFEGIVNFVIGVFTGNWERAWQGVQDSFGRIFEGLVNLAKKPFNGIIDMINGLIGKINSFLRMLSNALSFDIGFDKPDWMGGGHVGFKYDVNLGQIGYIPRLANGGYVKPNTPQLAMIGDNRHQGEVVAPEGKLTEMAIAAAKAAGNNASQEMMMLLQQILELLKSLNLVALDEESLRKYFINKTNQNTRSNGKSELIL